MPETPPGNDGGDTETGPIAPTKHRRQITVRRMLGVVFACGCAFGLIAWINSAREEVSCSRCATNLKMIALAMHNYHNVYGCLPPASVVGADGKPMHSWRVLIFPYAESNTFYSRYRLDEPWDGPNNRQLHGETPSFYFCPSHPGRSRKGQTSYFVVVGPGTPFPGANRSTGFVDARGSRGDLGNPFLVIESANIGIHWMEPRDLDWNRMSFRPNDPSRPSISARHRGGPNVVKSDGRVVRLWKDMPPDRIRDGLTVGGTVDRPPASP